MGMGEEMLMEEMIFAYLRQQSLCKGFHPVYIEELDSELVEKGIWRMKDGRLIKIREMSSHHLQNTIAMLERRKAHIDCENFECLMQLQNKMKAELASRFHSVDRSEGFYDDIEASAFD